MISKSPLPLLATALFLSVVMASAQAALKPRILVLTDISTWEPDDHESLIRLLVHADLFEIEGLVFTTGWSISDAREHKRFMDIIHGVIEAYEQDAPNLLKRSNQTGHDQDDGPQEIGYWPSPDYLRKRTVMGSRNRGVKFIGADNHSAGSDLIIAQAGENDDRPVWISIWGGGNTLAQAIWQVQQTRSDAELKAFLKKIPTYAITDQDRHYDGSEGYEISSHQWIRREFADDLLFIWDECAWRYQNATGRDNWPEYESHIQNHGALGRQYPKYRFGVEGDTPSFLHIIPNGLNTPETPMQVGWGGYFELRFGPDGKTVAFTNHEGAVKAACDKYVRRFHPAIFNNFAARMDWAKDGSGNRNPVVVVNSDEGFASIKLAPAQGDSVVLDASSSKDPDGDKLKFSWWVLPEAGTYADDIAISGDDTSRATVTVPSDAAGKSIHVICEVTDDGMPNLTSYRRINFEPTGTGATDPGAGTSVKTPKTTPQPTRKASERQMEQEPAAGPREARQRLRVIMTSDFPPIGVVKGGDVPNNMKSDPDDMQSMVRFLLYANEFDIEGLIASAGAFAMEAHKKNILDVIDRYELAYDNLKKRDPSFPTPAYLRSVTFEGRGNNHGLKIIWGHNKQPYTDIIGKGLDSEASRAIVAAADKPDPRPIWIGVWGGPREVAQAIWDVKHTRSEAELKAFISKLRVFLISYQDATHGWLMEQFPDLFVIESRKTYQGMFGGHDPLSDLAWVNEHVRNNHGPLGDIYPHEGMGCTGVCEGDSPTFLYLSRTLD